MPAQARMLITGERYLRLVLGEYVEHYNVNGRTRHCSRIRQPGARIRPHPPAASDRHSAPTGFWLYLLSP